jgi:antiviral helicase SKI2
LIAEINKIIDINIHKLENKEVYKNLDQLNFLRKILEKGIGIHHSGLIPILKEIVEILFSKNLIKILFCTVLVGIFTPTANVSVQNNILIKFFENNISTISFKIGINPE